MVFFVVVVVVVATVLNSIPNGSDLIYFKSSLGKRKRKEKKKKKKNLWLTILLRVYLETETYLKVVRFVD